MREHARPFPATLRRSRKESFRPVFPVGNGHLVPLRVDSRYFRERSSRGRTTLVVRLNQSLKSCVHRRQIVFPTPFTFAGWELGITPLYFFFKVHAHARHDFQV